jgi:phospholipid/cholesterol/gamma-HCH transport system ATP-binding protein
VTVLGQDITGRDDRGLLALRKRVGLVFQSAALFDSMSVFDNLAYPLLELGVEDTEQIRTRVLEALRMVDLDGKDELMPAQLSGGMRKRVGIARAVVTAPEILLYDDPTAGLDPVNVRRIDELILRLRRELGLTSVVVTHDLASAYLLSDRIAMLARHRIIEIGPVSTFRASGIPEVRGFVDAMPTVGGSGVIRARAGTDSVHL